MISHKLIPNISVDCVVFGFDFVKLNVLLVERVMKDEKSGKVIINDHTLAGYHIYEDEELDSAAARILKGLTGLDNIFLEQFGTYGQLDRVTGEKDRIWTRYVNLGFSDRVVTVGYLALIDSTKVELQFHGRNVQWYPVSEVKDMDLAFDHKFLFLEALKALQEKVKVEPIAFELLPDYFTLSQLQKLYEALLGTSFDKRNFRKKVAQMHYVIPLKRRQQGVAHKPAQYYLFSREVYDKTLKGRIAFIL